MAKRTTKNVYFRHGDRIEIYPNVIIESVKGGRESPVLLRIEADETVKHRHVPAPRPAKPKVTRS